jgi:hypothetical protein
LINILETEGHQIVRNYEWEAHYFIHIHAKFVK